MLLKDIYSKNYIIRLDINKNLSLSDCMLLYNLYNNINNHCIKIVVNDTNYSLNDSNINLIKDDLNWLLDMSIEINSISDYFKKIFEYTCQLIKNGYAYVDDLTDNNSYKDRTIEENLGLFLRMNHGEFEPNEKVLRIKANSLNDPIIYRINTLQYPQIKTQFIYPVNEFANIAIDYFNNISWIITNNSINLYKWFMDNFNYNSTLIVTRKINIDQNYTLKELRDKNISPQVIINFINQIVNYSGDQIKIDKQNIL